MNGDKMTLRVRRILRDIESDTKKGEFWDDREIRLALNIAQDLMTSQLIETGNTLLLMGLVKTTALLTDETTLPTDYLHYIAGMVGEDEDNLNIAKIYNGGIGYIFLYSKQNSVVILNNNLYFKSNGIATNGKLTYYSKPSYIGLTSLGDDIRSDFSTISFEQSIYNDMIVDFAATLLSYKETQTQRDYKKYRNYIQSRVMQPKRIDNNIVDTSIAQYRKMIPQQGEQPQDGGTA